MITVTDCGIRNHTLVNQLYSLNIRTNVRQLEHVEHVAHR